MQTVYFILLLLSIGILFYNEMYLMSFVVGLIAFALYFVNCEEKKKYSLEEITCKVQEIIENNKLET